MEVVYRRRSDYEVRGLTYRVERSTDLMGDPAWTTNGAYEIGSAAIDANFESVTNFIDSEDVLHGRLEIELSE